MALDSHNTPAQHAATTPASLARIEALLSSDPAGAEAEATELLQRTPGQDMAVLFQGIARRLQGKASAALAALQPLAARCPDAPLVHLQLGLALREAGQNEAAVDAVRRALGVKEDFADAWLALAGLQHAMGEASAADEAFVRYARYATGDPRLQEAALALKKNRLAEAESMLRLQLQQQAMDIVALCMLAEVVERRGRSSEAEELLKNCLELAPGYTRARQNYAVMLMRQNKSGTALVEIERLLEQDPTHLELRKLRAAVLVRLRQYQHSISICEAILDEFPAETSVWTSLGHMLKTVGRRDAAVSAYRRAIAQAPHYGEPWWSLANLKTLPLADADLDAMLEQLARSGLEDSDRLHLHFACGRALEDRKAFAESFEHYAEGNRIRLKSNPFRADEFEDHVRRCQEFFSVELFQRLGTCGSAAADPIFVLGLPRSGSTLVEQILASHSQVEGTMELTEIPAMASRLDKWQAGAGGPAYPEILATLGEADFAELGRAYLEQTRIQRQSDRPFFIDKMPNNFAHLGLIHLILPNARIIDVRRHPLACGFSLFKEHFAGGQNFSYSLQDIGACYRGYVALMRHFDKVLPGRVHRVIYESLVDNTETEIRRLLQYCELAFEPACVAFHRNERAVSTASSEQVRSPIFRAGIDHWRHYEAWLGPLKNAVGDLADRYPDL